MLNFNSSVECMPSTNIWFIEGVCGGCMFVQELFLVGFKVLEFGSPLYVLILEG